MKYFNRFEIKYQISLRERDNFINFIEPFTYLDTHTKNGRDYEIRSLYFESPFGTSLLEKQFGVGIRKKLRIRYYPDFYENDEPLAFIELKKKINENVAKRRIIVPLTDSMRILNNESNTSREFYKNATADDRETLNEIWYLYKKFNLKPACIVSYKRQAFLSKLEQTLRVTFDTNVFVRNYNFDLQYGGGSRYIVPRGISIMEIKFNTFVPHWVIKIIQKNDFLQYKISKFAMGLEKTKIFGVS